MKIQSKEQYKTVKEEFEQMAKTYSVCGSGPVCKLQKMSDALGEYEQSIIKAGTIKQTLKEAGVYPNRMKFRAWDGTRMIKPEELGMYPHKNIKKLGHPLMQSTGLADKNSIEIFEGDIVKDQPNRVVLWGDEWSGWGLGLSTDDKHLWYLRGEIEVIGNRFENPELLGEKL